MNKPASLRAALENALPELRDNPDRLLMFIEQGNLAARPGSLSFSYGYTLSIVVLEFASHPDSIMVPVLDWVQVNEPPLMQNADRLADGLKFEAEILSTSSWDFRLTIKLTERVSVQKQADGSVNIAHLPEPSGLGMSRDLWPNWKRNWPACWPAWTARRAARWPARSPNSCKPASNSASATS
jgi:hypothetical protein